MKRYFNTEGFCNPTENYMVALDSRLEKIKRLVDDGKYFSINCARQYGKTTVLNALEQYLQRDYQVISLDFQLLSHADFASEPAFVAALAREIQAALLYKQDVPEEITKQLIRFTDAQVQNGKLALLFACFSQWCGQTKRKIVLLVDEVDSAANNQVFLDFLAQLRGYYLHRKKRPAFWSVILAGVYDIKHLKLKFSPDTEYRQNSPWNIAADFLVNMSFSVSDIEGMLGQYERDHHTGMHANEMAQWIYAYTSGYPFLVSRICKIMDEQLGDTGKYPDKSHIWTKEGFLDAVNCLLSEKNTLFESLISKLEQYPRLKNMLYVLLFMGQSVSYNPDDTVINIAAMFGFIRENSGMVAVANRIFETRLYNLFLASAEMEETGIYQTAVQDKCQFIQHGRLDMELVLQKFVQHFHELYGNQPQKFLEEDGRRYFLLYLRPIINGTGNYYIEAQTRTMERTDVIIDYCGEQFIVEMKIWRGDAYHIRGEQQLINYLNEYHLTKGYMLSFNFNQKKQIGVKKIHLGDKWLIEAVV